MSQALKSTVFLNEMFCHLYELENTLTAALRAGVQPGSLLSVNTATEVQIEIFEKQDIVQLREFQGETVLLIGCGNMRFRDSSRRLPSWQELVSRHRHPEAYSINEAILMNPSALGLFGLHSFAHLPDGHFKEIWFERECLEAFADKNCIVSSALRLLRDGGCVSRGQERTAILHKQGSCLQHVSGGQCLRSDDDSSEFLWLMWPELAEEEALE